MIDQVTDGFDMAIAFDVVTEDQAVAKNCLCRVRIGEEGIPCKSHAGPINRDEKRHLVFGVAGGMSDFKIILFPLESLAMSKGPGHFEGLA